MHHFPPTLMCCFVLHRILPKCFEVSANYERTFEKVSIHLNTSGSHWHFFSHPAMFHPFADILFFVWLFAIIDLRWKLRGCSRWIWKWKASQSRQAVAGWPGRWSTQPVVPPHKRLRQRFAWHRRNSQALCLWPWWVMSHPTQWSIKIHVYFTLALHVKKSI